MPEVAAYTQVQAKGDTTMSDTLKGSTGPIRPSFLNDTTPRAEPVPNAFKGEDDPRGTQPTPPGGEKQQRDPERTFRGKQRG
jgi:hypothetical protein